ncbi:hypothetical protein LCGC14_1123950 [marine sediment metagenome]|uniref:Uncharacterized protein n=1 Tax=marine sediment metagenome TaxID=412755 RepID=A0A0F9Q907_9ZZZZ
MAATVVKDSQLRLDPVISQKLRLERTDPTLEIRETDQALPNGLWRIRVLDSDLRFEENDSVAGDFFDIALPLRLVGSPSLGIVVQFSMGLPLTTATGSVIDNTLFRDSTDERLHFRDNSSVDQTVSYLSDTIQGAAYVVRETPTGDLDGVDVTYVLANTPVTGTEHVYLNGMLQDEGGGNDYTISAATITFATAPISTDKVRVTYVK